jgi:hypothetical protein
MRDVTLSKERLVRAVYETAWDEIITDMRNKIVPSTVRSFSELHDHVDANMYGGSALLLALLDMPRATEILNESQRVIDAWLAKAEHLKLI